MRHSAWTLWLVPLALPLVLLCIPGSREPLDSRSRDHGGAAKVVQTDVAPPPEDLAVMAVPSDPTSDDLGAEPAPS
jgi:hypothetical protein